MGIEQVLEVAGWTATLHRIIEILLIRLRSEEICAAHFAAPSMVIATGGLYALQ